MREWQATDLLHHQEVKHEGLEDGSRRSPLPLTALASGVNLSARANTLLFQDADGTPMASTTFAGDFIVCLRSRAQECVVTGTGHGPGIPYDVGNRPRSSTLATLAGIVLDQLTVSPDSCDTPPQIQLHVRLSGLAPNGTTCASVGGCQFTADGSVQILGTIIWTSAGMAGFMDTVEFQAVPEPANVALVSSG